MQNLRGMIWNGGGFGDIAKHRFVKDSIREAMQNVSPRSTSEVNKYIRPKLNW
jgi:hypothetical protein